MPADDHLGEQLRMFMTARELHRMPSSDAIGWSNRSNMWRAKRRDNERTGLAEHVAEHGVHVPVTIAHGLGEHPMIWEGHRRITAAFDAAPDSYVPVEHMDVNIPRSEPSPERFVPDYDVKPHFPSYP